MRVGISKSDIIKRNVWNIICVDNRFKVGDNVRCMVRDIVWKSNCNSVWNCVDEVVKKGSFDCISDNVSISNGSWERVNKESVLASLKNLS